MVDAIAKLPPSKRLSGNGRQVSLPLPPNPSRDDAFTRGRSLLSPRADCDPSRTNLGRWRCAPTLNDAGASSRWQKRVWMMSGSWRPP